MEITEINKECIKCNKALSAIDNFCSTCGEKRGGDYRSENEVKAMIKLIEDFKPQGFGALYLALLVPILITLSWVQGNNLSPITFLKDASKKFADEK